MAFAFGYELQSDFKEFKEWFDEDASKEKSCEGCIRKNENNEMCGLVSSLCVNSKSRPYFRKKAKSVS